MLFRAFLYCLASGLVFACVRAQSILPNSRLAWLWLEGLVLAAAFLPVARWGPRHRMKLLAVVWLVLIVVGAVSLHIETFIFTTFSLSEVLAFFRDDLLALTALAIALAFLAGPLRISADSTVPVPPRPSAVSLAWRTLVAGLAYIVLYFVVGGIFYELFTKPYFEDPSLPFRAGEETILALGVWFPLIQIGRGAVMVAASLPLIFTLRLARGQAAIVLGLIFWVSGGLAPLIIPSEMPAMQRVYHTFEILFQHGGLGLVAVWLLRPKPNRET